MPERPGRRRLLALYRILHEESDPEHRITTRALCARLGELGLPVARKAIYEDIEALRQMGLDLRYQHPEGWCNRSGRLSAAELRLLCDMLQAAQSLSAAQTLALIETLSSFASRHQQERLRGSLCLEGRPKGENIALFEGIDLIQTALRDQRSLSFQYYTYNLEKQKVFMRGGDRYVTSPRGLLWQQEKYYLIAVDHRTNAIGQYRVDQMQNLRVLTLPARPAEERFDPAAYSLRHSAMCDGPEARVKLRCHQALAGLLFDRFGMDAALSPDGPMHCLLIADIALNEAFYGWLLSLGDKARLIAPYHAIQDFQTYLRAALERHQGFG